MGISRFTPPRNATRLLATTVAGIAALAVIALGVRIGTTGLGFGDDRAPATATARPASALVDLAAAGGSSDVAATVVALLPPPARDTTASRGAEPQAPQGSPQPDQSGGSEPPALTPAVPDPTGVMPPSPIPPAPVPPTTLPPAPGSAPGVDPVTDPVLQTIDDVKDILGL